MLEEDENRRSEMIRQASLENKPTCNICFDKIDFEQIDPLECKHIFHLECMAGMVRTQVESKQFPI